MPLDYRNPDNSCRRMAVTHADLSLGRRKTDLGSKWGTFLIVFSLLCGLSAFISCLIAETMRSEATWIIVSTDEGERYECVYSGSGITPLSCATGAFFVLAVAMIIEYSYIFVAVSKSSEASMPPLISWTSDTSSSTSSLRLQAAFYFISAWICFAVGEVLLIIGIGVESGHLNKWRRGRSSCLVIRPGLFAAAGVFSLSTVFFAAVLYLTALRTQRIHQNEENVRREILDASVLYASPVRSPRNVILPASPPESSLDMEEIQLSQIHHPAKPSNSL